MISTYNDGGQPVAGLQTMVIKRLTMTGFGFTDFPELAPAFRAEMTGWMKAGRLKWRVTVAHGLDRAPEALIGLFTGANTGKMLLRL